MDEDRIGLYPCRQVCRKNDGDTTELVPGIDARHRCSCEVDPRDGVQVHDRLDLKLTLEDLARSLSSLGRTTSFASIAVRPFITMSRDQQNELLSDGVTEDNISALMGVEGLRVGARSSVFQFKGRLLLIAAIPLLGSLLFHFFNVDPVTSGRPDYIESLYHTFVLMSMNFPEPFPTHPVLRRNRVAEADREHTDAEDGEGTAVQPSVNNPALPRAVTAVRGL